ncbi:hypothetical protein pEaSNUABM37_00001 [Erwinia phage pEa_SNUABM_37]|nr:hypothetical protein pEaSNUABM37_00001 [Erwinia phage pEa_SNUABM_37]QXO10471.1 hypothetical protein pEaSNUABM48_00001 [Erwinia phage pEa_SNUABM_48]
MSNDHQVKIVDEKDRLFEFGADIKTTVSVLSSLPIPLVVRQRNGVSSVIRPKHGAGYNSGVVKIQLEVQAKPEVFLNISQQSMESLPEEYQILYQAIQTMKDRGAAWGGMHYARICLTYSREFLERHGGEFYSTLADLVISILPEGATQEHPYCISAIQKQQSSRLQDDFEGLVLYAVRLIDRFDQLGPRYMNINGDIFRIEPEPLERITEQMADGLHFLGTHPMSNAKDITRNARTTYVAMEKLLKDPTEYGLWLTFGEARHQGNKTLETAQNALKESQKLCDKKDRLIENLKKDVEEAKNKQKQEGSLVMHKGITELIKLATAMIGIVKLLK